jgi:hypothetical protein
MVLLKAKQVLDVQESTLLLSYCCLSFWDIALSALLAFGKNARKLRTDRAK